MKQGTQKNSECISPSVPLFYTESASISQDALKMLNGYTNRLAQQMNERGFRNYAAYLDKTFIGPRKQN